MLISGVASCADGRTSIQLMVLFYLTIRYCAYGTGPASEQYAVALVTCFFF